MNTSKGVYIRCLKKPSIQKQVKRSLYIQAKETAISALAQRICSYLKWIGTNTLMLVRNIALSILKIRELRLPP